MNKNNDDSEIANKKILSLINEQIRPVNDFIPSKQINFLPNFLKNNEEYEEKSVRAILNKVQIADSSFINSALSYSIYKSNMWIIDDLKKDFTEMTVKVEQALHDPNQFYNLKLWHFNKNFFEKIEDRDLKLPAMGGVMNQYGFMTNFYFKDGHYSAANDLAHACVVKSKHPTQDGYVMHVCFRGTDFTRLPDFVKKAYLDMSAYYENFKPLEKAVMNFAKDPPNGIVEIQVSGHSLGGAMVQEFLKNNPYNKDANIPPIKGFTFGSPGSKKHLYHKFLSMGYHLVFHKKLIWSDSFKKDTRLNEFYHTNDPVPKIGVIGYKKGGDIHNLFDNLYEEAKVANLEKLVFLEKLPIFGKMITYAKETLFNKTEIKFHDSKRYNLNIKNLIENHYKAFPHLAQELSKRTQYWEKYIKIEDKFKSLSVRHRKSFEKIISANEPDISSLSLEEKILNIRANMSYDSESARILSASGQLKNFNDFFLQGRGTKQIEARQKEYLKIKQAILNKDQIMDNLYDMRAETLKNIKLKK